MRFHKNTILILFFLVLFSCFNVFALDLGQNITIFDGSSNTNKKWYSDREDQEVEANCEVGQIWDLEGFFLNHFKLTVVGGFDFINGQKGFESGDIFIDTNLDAIYGDNAKNKDSLSTNSNQDYYVDYGYEYAVDLDFSNLKYQVYEIDKNYNSLTSVYYRQNDGSNPWRYNPHPNENPIYSDDIFYYTGLSDLITGFSGENHNAFTIDLSFLPKGAEFIAHFTIGCGNDNLMGRGIAHTPEPATFLLAGAGLLGIVAVTRKRFS